MTTTVADIGIRVGGDVTDLQEGMAKGSQVVGKFAKDSGRQLRKTANRMAKVGAAATAAGAAIVAGLYNQGSKAIDRQAKLARQLDTTQASIAALTRQAELSGVAQQQLEKNVQAYNKRLGEAIDGQGEAKVALDKMNLSARELAKLPLDEQMALIAEKINGMGTSAERAAAASDLFSRAGLDMLNFFEGGGPAIRAARKEVEGFGLAVSDVDAAQVEAANDAMTSIQATVKGVSNSIAVGLAPYVQEVSERFSEASQETGGFKDEVNTAIQGTLRGFAKVADVLHGVRVAFKGLELVATGFGAAVMSTVQLALEGLTKLHDSVIQQINAIIFQLNKIPEVDIAQLDLFTDSPFMKGVRNMGNTVRNRVGEVRSQLHDLATQELPSDSVQKFLEDVGERSRDAAAKVVEARKQMITIPEDKMGGQAPGPSENELQSKLDRLQESFMTEQEMLAEKYEKEQELLRQSLENKLITKQEFNELERQSEEKHQSNLTDIEKRNADERKRAAENEARVRMRAIGGALSDLTTLMNSENKKQFEIGKKAAIAQTIMRTWSSAQGAFESLSSIPIVGPVLGAAAAAAAVAAGFQRVNAIRSQSMGGSGGAGAAASNTAAVNAASTPTGQGGGPGGGQPQQTMRVEGLDKNSLFSGDAVETIAQGLLDFQKDGGEVVFNG